MCVFRASSEYNTACQPAILIINKIEQINPKFTPRNTSIHRVLLSLTGSLLLNYSSVGLMTVVGNSMLMTTNECSILFLFKTLKDNGLKIIFNYTNAVMLTTTVSMNDACPLNPHSWCLHEHQDGLHHSSSIFRAVWYSAIGALSSPSFRPNLLC